MPRKLGKARPRQRKIPAVKRRDRYVQRSKRSRKKTVSALHRALELFRDQYGPAERIAMLREEYGISEETAYRWQREALARMNALEVPTSDRIIELREQTRIALEDTYRAARTDRDHSGAVRAQAERARIFGLQAPLEVRHGGSNAPDAKPIEVSAPILEKRTAELRAELVGFTARARALATPDPTPAKPETAAAPAAAPET